MFEISTLLNILEIISITFSLGSVILATWKLIIKPIRSVLELQKTQSIEITEIKKANTEIILPMVNSLYKEFSKNGGKSIKDQLNRIDDAVALAELRSQMIASSLVSVGAYECDKHGECTWANKALCEMFGLPLADVLGRGWLSAINDEERHHVWKKWTESIQLNIPFETEYTIVNQSTQESYPARTTAVTHRSKEDGRVLGFYGTVMKQPIYALNHPQPTPS